MVVAVVLALALTSPDRPFADERQLLARRLETLRRILPDGPTPQADVALIKELAEGAKFSAVDALARPPVEMGSVGAVIIDLTATARFLDVDRFFRQALLSYRLIDVESLSLTASDTDLLKMTAVVRLPFRPTRAPLPAPPDGTRAKLTAVPRVVADAFVHDQAVAVAKTEAIVNWRRTRRNPRLFLSELAATLRDRPVILRQATLGEEFRVRGLASGEGTVRALESRFERGFFRVSSFLMARQGACHHFEVRGTSPVAGPDAELPLASDDPFAQDDSPCRVDRDTSRTLNLKAAKPKANASGPLTLRLRGVDVADVFLILNQLTSQGFLVDGDVTGRVYGDLSRVTLDEGLSALGGELGLAIAPNGPVRRVSLSGNGAARPEPKASGKAGKKKQSKDATPAEPAAPVEPSGPRLSLMIKRADVRDILATLADVDATYGALGPQGPLGRASVWARDAAIADLWGAVTRAAGLHERFEEGRRLVERNPGSQDVLVPVASAPPDAPRLVLRAQDLVVGELDLVAVATAADGWRAYSYTPGGRLVAYRVGDKLADGVVKGIESTDVLLETDEGPVRVMLPGK